VGAMLLASTRSISASQIRFNRAFSAIRRASCRSQGDRSSGGTAASETVFSSNDHSGQRVIDVHAIDLLAVGAETDHAMAAQQHRGIVHQILGLQLGMSQAAVAPQRDPGRAEAFFNGTE